MERNVRVSLSPEDCKKIFDLLSPKRGKSLAEDHRELFYKFALVLRGLERQALNAPNK